MKSIFKIITFFFLTLLLYTLSSCDNNPDNKKDYFHEQNDSLFILLNRVKDESMEVEKRKNNLYDAYRLNSKQQNLKTKNKLLLKITSQAFKLKDTILFKRANKEAQNISSQLKDTFSIAKTHWNLAYYYTKKEVLDSTYFHYNKAYNYYNAINHEYYSGKMLFGMAYVQGRLKDFVGCETNTFKAINIFNHLDKNKSLYKCYDLLGNIYKELGEYDSSIEFHQKALACIDKLENNNTHKVGLYNNIGLTYLKQKNYNTAISYFNRALKNDNVFIKKTTLYAKLLDNLSYSKLLKGDTLEVEKELLYSLKVRDSLNDFSGIIINKIHLAEYHLQNKDTIKAYNYAKSANELAKSVNNNRDILASLELLADIDIKNSKNYLKEHITLSNEHEQHERKLRNQFARIRFKTDEYKEEASWLSLQRTLITIIGLGLITILSLVYYIRHQRGKNRELRLEAEQQQANEEIYQLMLKQQTKLEEGRMKERHRISEELHDGVLGRIFGTRMGLGFLDFKADENTKNKHQEYIDELQEIENEIRIISHELKHELLSSEADYISLIDHLATTQSKIGGFEYDIEQSDGVYWSAIPDLVKINLYRIIQEALQNINKHAKANKVSISFLLKDKTLELKIEDDGIGFDLNKKRLGIGLVNMDARVKKLNGTFAIESHPNKGTTLRILVPVVTHL